MPVNFTIPDADQIAPVAGVRIGVTMAGIRKQGRRDLTVFLLDEGSTVSGVFTRNRYCAAPVQVCQQHLAPSARTIRALVINTGNANAGTGEPGLAAARRTCQEMAARLGLKAEQVLPFSTGVIMEPLPVDRVVAGLDAAIAAAGEGQWFEAAHGIMTTDTVPKIASRRVVINGVPVAITGISKGAGMIRPNMATMLGFVATDAGIDQALLDSLTLEIAEQSFNRITVDGDTSTNDSFVVMATGRSGLMIRSTQEPAYAALRDALASLALELAQKIVRDAEGATKFITIEVTGAASRPEALQVAYSIAHSPLVKTAFYASDPNLGRILAAVGYAGVADLDQTRVAMWLDEVKVVEHGGRHPDYREEDGQRVMKQSEIRVRVDLGRGSAHERVYTCDFSHDYVSINADYRS